MEAGWFQYLDGLQAISSMPDMWIGCFPSSVFEPATLEAVRHDEMLTKNGKKEYQEMGWFEMGPQKDLDTEVKEFLDKHGKKSVVYIRWVRSVKGKLGPHALLNPVEVSEPSSMLEQASRLSLATSMRRKRRSSLPVENRRNTFHRRFRGYSLKLRRPGWVSRLIGSIRSVSCDIR